jgi:predicted nuclease of predicted toxin-antitoxin system
MGISMGTVTYLREAGHDALHLREQGLQRLADPEIVQKARDEGRVILTNDLDFAQLAALSGGETAPSVIIFRLADMRPASVNRHLTQVLQIAQADLDRGAIVSVREGQVRVHLLPI